MPFGSGHGRAAALVLGMIMLLCAGPPWRPARAIETTAATAARDALLDRDVQEMYPRLVETRRDFHMYPELSNREARTAKIVAERLRAAGLEVRAGVARHGVVGLLKGALPGGVVAIRADMDALPIQENRDVPYKSKNAGVMHACGHDVHTTVALGTAELLARRRDLIRGTIKFIFQPAEEMASDAPEWGAKLMVREGVLRDPAPSAIFGLHCSAGVEAGKISYCETATTAAADTWTVKIRGRMAHGAYPQLGTDAIVVAAAAIMQLQTIRSRRTDTLEPLVLTVGTIHGGNRENIVADEVEFRGTVRTYSEALQEQVIQLMRQTLKGVTDSFGASYTLDYQKGYPPTINNLALVRRTLPTLRRVNGEAGVVPSPPSMGGEDFAWYAREIPGFFFWLGVGNRTMGITAGPHTPDFDVDEKAIATGVKTMAAVALDYLESEVRSQKSEVRSQNAP
ncbi:MAG: M20 family metallopeptidase [Blastocatellia bacterium]